MSARIRQLSDADMRAAATVRMLWAEYKKKNHGISQETAAERAGMTQSAFSQFLKGTVPMRVSPVLKFAKLFGVEPTEIRDDLTATVYGQPNKARRLEARSPELDELPHDAIEIARAFNGMSPQTQDFVRQLVFTYALIDKSSPWLRQGRPRSHNYAPWEKWHVENRNHELTLAVARFKKK